MVHRGSVKAQRAVHKMVKS